MKGYWDDPVATDAALRGDWLFTGDYGYVDDAGYLFFVDRKNDLIKRGGENVSASEVETVLLEHPDVANVAVIGVPDPIRDEAVKAFVVLRKGSVCQPDALIAHCREQLALFKVPTMVEIVHELPMTSIGKIEKKALRAQMAAR
jgi:crotonobetaine/carnitine-CoA ligase